MPLPVTILTLAVLAQLPHRTRPSRAMAEECPLHGCLFVVPHVGTKTALRNSLAGESVELPVLGPWRVVQDEEEGGWIVGSPSIEEALWAHDFLTATAWQNPDGIYICMEGGQVNWQKRRAGVRKTLAKNISIDDIEYRFA